MPVHTHATQSSSALSLPAHFLAPTAVLLARTLEQLVAGLDAPPPSLYCVRAYQSAKVAVSTLAYTLLSKYQSASSSLEAPRAWLTTKWGR
jgi:hypothetical protein